MDERADQRADQQAALALFGTTQPVAPARRLKAGPLSCEFSDGQLRNVRWGEVEIVRGLSYLLRDQNWGTVPATIDDEVVKESAESFELRFRLRMVTPSGQLNATAHLHGRSDGQLVFEVRATASAAMETNRCGLVILHPASAAGRELRVEHTGGGFSELRFPLEISPSQPVFDIRALSYSPADGLKLQLRLEADLPGDPAGKFEMEDQRNWSDASFKTYVASLLDPWPYGLPAGQELVQRVSVSVQGPAQQGAARGDAKAAVSFGATSQRVMPAIGVGIPPGLSRASADEVAALRSLAAGWWLVEADLRDTALAADLAAVVACRFGLAAQVQLDAIAPESATPQQAASMAAELCQRAGLSVDAVRLLAAPYLKSFQPSDRWPELAPLEDYANAARQAFPRALVGGGMYTSFTELNRKRQSAQGLDFIGHLSCPTVHAPEDQSVMQTIECLPHIVHSVHSLWPGLAYRLGPSSIAPRRNPYGETTAANPRGERLALAAVDPRHGAQFGAAWTVAYAAAVAALGLEVLALHDSHGSSGPMAAGRDGAAGRSTVPAWWALGRLAKAAGARWIPMQNLPPEVSGIAWSHDGSLIEGLVANLTAQPLSLRWTEPVQAAGSAPTSVTALAGYQVCDFKLMSSPQR